MTFLEATEVIVSLSGHSHCMGHPSCLLLRLALQAVQGLRGRNLPLSQYLLPLEQQGSAPLHSGAAGQAVSARKRRRLNLVSFTDQGKRRGVGGRSLFGP